MVYLTEDTISFVINGNDRNEEVTLQAGKEDRLSYWLNEDWGIQMGSYLDPNVEEYYCEVIQYMYNAYKPGIEFTQLYSNLEENGNENILDVDKARKPLTQFTSCKINVPGNDLLNGITRQATNQRQNNTFICQNFNQQVKYFRMSSLHRSAGYSFRGITTRSNFRSYGSGTSTFPYTSVIDHLDGAPAFNFVSNSSTTFDWLKSYPVVIMYMTPIYKNRVPRLLKEDDAITLTISSAQRSSGIRDFGHDCIIPFKQIGSKYRRFKAVFQCFNLLAALSISEGGGTQHSINLNMVSMGWNTSMYGYGGAGKYYGRDAIILSSFPIVFNYLTNENAHLASYNGAVIEIENINKDIQFKFMMSQMVVPSVEDLHASIPYGFLNSLDPKFEWILTMKLYGLD
jgi:hypothetical protein